MYDSTVFESPRKKIGEKKKKKKKIWDWEKSTNINENWFLSLFPWLQSGFCSLQFLVGSRGEISRGGMKKKTSQINHELQGPLHPLRRPDPRYFSAFFDFFFLFPPILWPIYLFLIFIRQSSSKFLEYGLKRRINEQKIPSQSISSFSRTHKLNPTSSLF